jgi:hypothetical protein
MESWNSADVLLCLTPILFLDLNIARLVLGLGDDVSALDYMYEMLKGLPGMCYPVKSGSEWVIDRIGGQTGVLSVEAGLLSSGVIFLVKSCPDQAPAIPIALQGITRVQTVPLPVKPRLLICEGDKRKLRTLPTRANRPPETTKNLRVLTDRQGKQRKVKQAVMQKGRKELEKARWMKVMQSRL